MNDQYFPPAGSFIDLTDYSSNLQDLTNLDGGIIRVTFKRGGVYDYYHCPPTLWDYLLKGKARQDGTDNYSIGAAFHQEVISKPDIYPFKRIS